MTQQEYDKAKEECWVDFCRKFLPEADSEASMKDVIDYAFDRAYALGKQEKDAEDDRTLKVNRQLFCRLCSDADDYINEHLEEGDSDYGYYQGRSDALHELYRGECKDEEDTVIQGWVYRDKKDNALYLHVEKPYRAQSGCDVWDDPDWWESDCPYLLPLDKSLFPNLTWESDPIEVELIIKRKKK